MAQNPVYPSPPELALSRLHVDINYQAQPQQFPEVADIELTSILRNTDASATSLSVHPFRPSANLQTLTGSELLPMQPPADYPSTAWDRIRSLNMISAVDTVNNMWVFTAKAADTVVIIIEQARLILRNPPSSTSSSPVIIHSTKRPQEEDPDAHGTSQVYRIPLVPPTLPAAAGSASSSVLTGESSSVLDLSLDDYIQARRRASAEMPRVSVTPPVPCLRTMRTYPLPWDVPADAWIPVEDTYQITYFVVDTRYSGVLIGNQGTTVRKIQSSYNVRVGIDPAHSVHFHIPRRYRIVSLRGIGTKISAALIHMRELLTDFYLDSPLPFPGIDLPFPYPDVYLHFDPWNPRLCSYKPWCCFQYEYLRKSTKSDSP